MGSAYYKDASHEEPRVMEFKFCFAPTKTLNELEVLLVSFAVLHCSPDGGWSCVHPWQSQDHVASELCPHPGWNLAPHHPTHPMVSPLRLFSPLHSRSLWPVTRLLRPGKSDRSGLNAKLVISTTLGEWLTFWGVFGFSSFPFSIAKGCTPSASTLNCATWTC